jgi:hypothetical protein
MTAPSLKAGELVEIRTPAEILATLDARGCLEGMPFMPEMLRFCGRRFRVGKRAHKTCDTVNKTGGRSVKDAVHLEDLRCDGAGHGGCQAHCLIFWKEAWLKRAAVGDPPHAVGPTESRATELIDRSAFAPGSRPDNPNPRYSCQTTELPKFTRLLPWWDVRQYIEDLASGNVHPGEMAGTFGLSIFRKLLHLGIGYRFLVGAYNRIQKRRGRGPLPFRDGQLETTPSGELGLQPGEWVRVKSHDDILGTLDKANRNRGLFFDVEMTRFCGGTYRVLRRVTQILNEKTGEMLRFTNPCILLDQVYCRAELSQLRLFCPRAIPSYWREIWLERLPGAPAEVQRLASR